jgi:flagellar biosynthetic protein FlhB
MTRLTWFDGMGVIVTDLLRFNQHLHIDRDSLSEFLLIPVIRAIALLAPLLGLILFISPLVTLIQTGFNIAKDKLEPNWERMDPVAGLQRMISMRQWIEGLKSTVKVGLFGTLAWIIIKRSIPEIQLLATLDVRSQLGTMIDISLAIGTRIAIMMAVLAVFDLGYQWWEFHKKLKMSHQEMKDEMKEREGDPLIKQRQRSLAMQRARQRMMAEVPKASVIVTNPTHFAVALVYNRDKAPAPYVCAKGTQHMALRIREIAQQHGIPIVENKPLARALYRQVRVGRMVPAEFFKAVAEVLAFVYLLKRRKTSVRQIQPARLPRPAGMMR